MPAADPAAPIADAELEALFAPLAAARGLALAVSGGADSLALLDCVDRWRRTRPGVPVVVLSVDHGLRATGADEAGAVAGEAHRRGLPARILTWPGPVPTANLEAAAREARYRLLIAAAREAGASHLVLAHHADDVAETFLMRLQRGAGVFGLAAMRAEVDAGDIAIARPFLTLRRARLAATTAAAGMVPVADPMNEDPRFARVRVRRLMPLLAREGLDAGDLAAAASRLAEAAEAIDTVADRLLADAAAVDHLAVVTADRTALMAAPAAVRHRALERLLTAAGGAKRPPRFERLAALASAMDATAGRWRRSLGGCIVERRGETVVFCREAGRAGLPTLPLAAAGAGTWDNRFGFSVDGPVPADTVLGALGDTGRREIGAKGPARALAALPAIRVAGVLRSVPTLDYAAGRRLPVAVRPIVAERLKRRPLFPAPANG